MVVGLIAFVFAVFLTFMLISINSKLQALMKHHGIQEENSQWIDTKEAEKKLEDSNEK
ncbi:hypothetical protein LCM20_09665 [Halobacillus litoralis]|uniref:hypothetical protein n=1 Tax=Halobacillus litoralis TaxID=45668 RepID=UPI001CD55768|nr:hypothetical protein [Halobacillus litoralis]MCA0970857.1 hypothetical protein [Halobacillus litoralis]